MVDRSSGTVTAEPVDAISTSTLLSDHTTFRVGGPVNRLVIASTEQQIIDTVTNCDERGEPLLVLSGGSNLLVGDGGFNGTAVRIATRGIDVDESSCGGAIVRVQAGESWDALVAHAVASEWIGVETLSGIPGLVGSTPIQNVGAYGSEVAETVASVRTWDRKTGKFRAFAAADCGFSYRNSIFKAHPHRYVVLQVSFQFTLGNLSAPIRYAELARRLEVPIGGLADTARVRQAVLALRAGKGMVLDQGDHDTWSAGSFFTNPLLSPEDAEKLPEEAPRYPAGDRVKASAAWLIQHAGFDKGYGLPPATLSTKHVLAITNRGGARAEDLLALARTVRDGVLDRFDVELVPEPVLLNAAL